MATTYYLSTAGSDSNTGASGSRWRTWSKAKSVMVAGDTLILTSGQNFTSEQWIIDFSGTASTAKITIESEDFLNPATIDGNYAYPTDPGTGGRTSRNGVRSLFKGLVEIRCPFVDFRYVNVRESQGHGIWIFGQPGNRNHDILVEHCDVSHHRSNCIGMQDADDCTIQYNVITYGSDYISGLTDGVSPGETWSAIIKTNLGANNTIQYCDVFHGWGEGIILAYGTSGCISQYCRIGDSASGKMYVQRGVDAVVQGNISFDTFDEAILKNGTDPSSGLSIRNEQKAGAGTPSTNNVLFANNISIGHRYNIVVGGAQGGTEATNNVRIFHNIFVNAQSRSSTAHNSIYLHGSANLTNIVFRNNLTWQPDGRICSLSTTRSGVTWDSNGWSLPQAQVFAWMRDGDDSYSILLTNPNATLVVGSINVNPEDYRPSTEYTGVVIAEITLDFYGNSRASNYKGALGTTGGGGGPPSVGSTFFGLGYATAGTGSGNFDITDTNLAGNTPEAVLTFLTQATSAGTAIDHWKIGTGAATAAAQWTMTSRGRDNQAAAVVATQGATDMTTMLRSESGAAVTHEASYNSFIADGVRLNKAGAMTDDAGIIAALFGGADCEVSAGTFVSNSAIGGTTVVTPNFEYDLLFVFAHAGVFDDANHADLLWSMGVSTDTSNQYCLAHYENNSAAPTDHRAHLNNAIIGLNIASGQTLTITGRTGTTFTATTGVATGARTWGYLALGYTGVKTYCGVATTPTTATSKKFTTGAAGNLFKPGLVITWQSLIDTLNSTKTNTQAGSLGVGLWTETVAQCVAVSDEDNVATTQTKQIRDTKPFHLLKDNGADSTVATVTSMDSDGTTLTFSAVETTARYFIIIAVEEASTLALGTGLDEGFGEDRGVLTALAATAIVGLDEGFGEDAGLLSTVLVALPTTVVPSLFPSRSRLQRITVEVYEPLNWSSNQLYDLTAQLESYSHTNNAFGGYGPANLRWRDNQQRMEDWFELGLGRRIVTRAPGGQVIWEGFVNNINLRLGELQVSRGPLLSIANQVRLIYSWIDPGLGIAIGARAKTDYNDDPDSQDRYGIVEKILSTGGVEPTNADLLRDMYLYENRRPETSQQINIGGNSGETGISVDCLGYGDFLNTYIYNQTATTGTIDLDVKLAAVLAAEPNGYFSTSTAAITPNATAVLAVENDDRKAMTIVKDLVAQGDGNFNRYLFGIYADRVAEYRGIAEQVDYTRRLSDPQQQILTPSGQVVAPWDVMPGRWLMYMDFFAGRVENTAALRDDPRAVFIESVTYRAPRDLEINGNKVRRLDQKLAQMGLSGIGG